MTEVFDAMLRNWFSIKITDASGICICIVGQIENDRRERFPDGRWILTTAISSPVDQISSGNVVTSRNTRYLLLGSVN
jgi:hypothetical protein